MSSSLVRLVDIVETGLSKGMKQALLRMVNNRQLYAEQVAERTIVAIDKSNGFNIAPVTNQFTPPGNLETALKQYFRLKNVKDGKTVYTSPHVYSRVDQNELFHDVSHTRALSPFSRTGESMHDGSAINEVAEHRLDSYVGLKKGSAEGLIRKHMRVATIESRYKNPQYMQKKILKTK